MPAPAIFYRTTGVWGAGIGANLTATQFDTNNYNIAQSIQGLIDNPPTPDNIADVDVTDNQLTITLEGGTVFGPFALPIAEFHDRGAFAAVDYVYGDIFTSSTAIYMVLQEHTGVLPFDPARTILGNPVYRKLFDASALTMTFLDDGYPVLDTPIVALSVFAVDDLGVYLALSDHDALAAFDPDALDVDANPLYKKIFSPIQTAIARIQFQFPGTFPADSSTILKLIQDDDRDLVFAADFPDSRAHLEVAVTAELVFPISYGGADVGAITFTPGDLLDGAGGQFGTITGAGATVAAGELFRVLAPDVADATGRYLTVALVGSYTP